MSNAFPNEITLREYADQRELTAKADAILKSVTELVEKELGTEKEGVTFMPALNVVCRLKSDPTSHIDPVSFSVIKRPNSSRQIHDIVNNIILKDQMFLSSILHGVAANLAEMMTVHFDMAALVNSMGEGNEENEVETDENKEKDSGSENKNDVPRYYKKDPNEVN